MHDAVFLIGIGRRATKQVAAPLQPLLAVKMPQHRATPVQLAAIRHLVVGKAHAEGDFIGLRQRGEIVHAHLVRQTGHGAFALLRHAPQRLDARKEEKHRRRKRQGDEQEAQHVAPAGELHPRPPQLFKAHQPMHADGQRKQQIEKNQDGLREHQKRQHQQRFQQKEDMHVAAVARLQQLADAHRHEQRDERQRQPKRAQLPVNHHAADEHQAEGGGNRQALVSADNGDELQRQGDRQQHCQQRRQKEKQRQRHQRKRRGNAPPFARLKAVLIRLRAHPADHAPPPNSASARKQASRCSRPWPKSKKASGRRSA